MNLHHSPTEDKTAPSSLLHPCFSETFFHHGRSSSSHLLPLPPSLSVPLLRHPPPLLLSLPLLPLPPSCLPLPRPLHPLCLRHCHGRAPCHAQKPPQARFRRGFKVLYYSLLSKVYCHIFYFKSCKQLCLCLQIAVSNRRVCLDKVFFIFPRPYKINEKINKISFSARYFMYKQITRNVSISTSSHSLHNKRALN